MDSGIDSSRRRFVAGVAAIGTAGFAGCSGILGGEGWSPKAALRNYVTADVEGNQEEAQALVHPEGPADGYTDQEIRALQQADVSVESIEVTERADGQATVSLTVSSSFGGGSDTVTSEFELRTHQGE